MGSISAKLLAGTVPSHNGGKLSARELDAEIRRLTAGVVREGKATPAELDCGTFTSYGVFAMDGSAAILSHPEVGILGMRWIIDEFRVVNGELAGGKVTELTVTFDLASATAELPAGSCAR